MSPITETLKVPRSSSQKELKRSDYSDQFFHELLTPNSLVGFVGNALDPVCTEISQQVAKLIIIDADHERIETARKVFEAQDRDIVFLNSKPKSVQIENECLDLLFCKKSLEFEADSRSAFEKLSETLKPGGYMVCEEADADHMNHYPMAPHLERQVFEMAEKLQSCNRWDPNIGRKLYSYYGEAGFMNVEIQLLKDSLIYGCSETEDQLAWTERLDKLQEAASTGEVQLSFDIRSFRRELQSFFENPHRFSYTALIRVIGQKSI